MKRRIGLFLSILACAAMLMTSKSVSADPIKEITDGGVYEIVSCINTNYVLDIDGGSTENRANLQLWPKNNSAAQRFQVRRVSGDRYTFTCLKSAKVIDAAMGSTKSGTNLWQWVSNGSDAQLYRLVSRGNGVFEIINAKSGLCVDASGGVAAKRTNVQLWRRNGSAAQRWILRRVGSGQPNNGGSSGSTTPQGNSQNAGSSAPADRSNRKQADIAEGFYEVQSALDTSLCLDIDGGAKGNRGNLQIWKRNGSKAQRFYIRKQNGVYYLRNYNSSKYIDAANGDTKKGTNVWQWQGNGSAAQQYRIYETGNGTYEIQSAKSGLYLDVKDGVAKSGQNVWLWQRNGSKAQRWLLNLDRPLTQEKTAHEKAREFISKYTYATQTREAKLRTCFENLVVLTYKNPWIPEYYGMDWPQRYANVLFDTRTKNCYSSAAAMAYIAFELGYNDVYACSSGREGNHGWAEAEGKIYDMTATRYAATYDDKTWFDYAKYMRMEGDFRRIKIKSAE